ncbi:MAG TPA: UPF0280 family protein [Candidatus Anoxymicrobiaceae bacterium]
MDENRGDERAYRAVMEPQGLRCFCLKIGESDLYVCTAGDTLEVARASLERHRAELESYLASHSTFGTSFKPVPAASGAPEIVADMAAAGEAFGVGPMASVAGAIAQWVGSDLLAGSSEVIVENGGDIFLAGGGRRRIRIFAGADSRDVDIIVQDSAGGIGVCTSSATVGPSVSFGAADAVTVIAPTATIADAAATAIGNVVLRPRDIEAGLEMASSFEDVDGAVIMLQGSMGAWGKVEIA